MPVVDPGEGPGGPTTTPLLALYSNQTEAQKIFWETRHPTPYLRVGMTGPLLPPPPPPSPFLKVWIWHYMCILLFFPLGESHSKNTVSCALYQDHNKMVWFQCTSKKLGSAIF